jgi:hypothetical protein
VSIPLKEKTRDLIEHAPHIDSGVEDAKGKGQSSSRAEMIGMRKRNAPLQGCVEGKRAMRGVWEMVIRKITILKRKTMATEGFGGWVCILAASSLQVKKVD